MAIVSHVMVVLSIIRITYGQGDLGLGGIGAVVNDLTGDLLPDVASLTKGLQSIEIPLVGKLGTIAIPLKTICKVPGVYDYVFCFICNQDCYVVHNKFGGTCAQDPMNPSEETCVCAESKQEARKRNIDVSSVNTCRRYLPSLPPFIAALDDIAVRIILRNRLALLQCPKYTNGTYNDSGCVTDCKSNHGVSGGYCANTVPRDSRLGTDETRHCECNKRSRSNSCS